jgi:hypothetical protein
MLIAVGVEILALETYTRHRPIRSLTDRVSPTNVAQIYGILHSLSPEQRRKFALEEVDGELYCNHWYITVLACKR